MSRFNKTNSDCRKKFFYAESDAGMYDYTIECVVPQYKLLHDAMLWLLTQHFSQHHNLEPKKVKGTVLDIGSGTGTESILLLRKFPHLKVVALDLCNKFMAPIFKANYIESFQGKNDIDKHVQFVTGDFLADAGNPKSLLDKLNKFSNGDEKRFSAIISAFTIHHFSQSDKQVAYDRIYSLLKPGGIFFNADLFNYEADTLKKYADRFDIEWIKNQFRNPAKEFVKSLKVDIKERNRLSKLWLEHYMNDNILHSATLQKKFLLDAGFSEVGIPFRYFQVGLLYALKQS